MLWTQGPGVSRGRIERLMRRHGIRAIMAPPRRVRTTDSRHDLPVAPNLIARDFTAKTLNRVWIATPVLDPLYLCRLRSLCAIL